MEKIALSIMLSLTLTACSGFGKLGEVPYNNEIVASITSCSTSFEESATLYNETIPDLVTELIEIDTTEMQSSYNEAFLLLTATDELLTLESKNLEQQNAVRTAIETYQSAGNNYLENYKIMLEYYAGPYKEDVTQVQSLDEDLHEDYTTFIQANNDLVETLENFVATTEES